MIDLKARRFAFVPALLLGAALLAGPFGRAAFSAGPTGVLAATRTDSQGNRYLLISARPALSGRALDKLQITLPANAAKRGVPENLPPNWIAKTHGKEITFLGSPRKDGKDLVFRVNVGNAVVPNRIKIKASAGRAGVFDAKVEVARLGVLRVIRDLRGLIALPALVSPGDQVVVEVLSPKTTPPGGIWSFSGVQAQEAPDRSLPGEGNPRLSFTLPATLAPGDRIEVVYTDPWGDRLVHVGAVDSSAVVSAGTGLGSKPGLTACSRAGVAGGLLCLCGRFPSESAWSGLSLDGIPLGPPLSASGSVAYVRLPLDLEPGRHSIRGLSDAGYGASDRVEFAAVRLSGQVAKAKFRRGESAPLRLYAQGTEEPVIVRLSNRTPDTISIEGGELQAVSTSGGNPNTLERTVRGLKQGDFSINYELDMEGCPCQRQPSQAPALADVVLPGRPVDAGKAPVAELTAAMPAQEEPPAIRMDPCGPKKAECEELGRLAQQAATLASVAQAAAWGSKDAQDSGESDAELLTEEQKSDTIYAASLRRRAADWLRLAQYADEDAKANWRRAREHSAKEFEAYAKQDEALAAQRRKKAEELDAEAEALEARIKMAAAHMTQLRTRNEAAREQALARTREVKRAQAAHAACLKQLKECTASAQ